MPFELLLLYYHRPSSKRALSLDMILLSPLLKLEGGNVMFFWSNSAHWASGPLSSKRIPTEILLHVFLVTRRRKTWNPILSGVGNLKSPNALQDPVACFKRLRRKGYLNHLFALRVFLESNMRSLHGNVFRSLPGIKGMKIDVDFLASFERHIQLAVQYV